jgi:hypothetical protein
MNDFNKETDVLYVASPTLTRFHQSRKFTRTIIGPIGSGKSVGCVIELLEIAYRQKPNANGVRRSRFGIIRNTYRELLDTTMKSFFEWINKNTGEYSASNLTFTLTQDLDDGTTLEAEFWFRALDKPGDIKKLLSLELTAAWINEVRELPKAVFDMTQGRVGRFPRQLEGGPTWHGVICDTNPPDADHWYYHLFEENLPSNCDIFHQPSGLSPNAENISNLVTGYYTNMIAGKTKEWINVYVHGQYGFIADGRPVYPEYNDDVHYVHSEFIPDKTKMIYIGIDFGLTPAAAIGQITSSGAFVFFDELVTFDMGAVSFGKVLHDKLQGRLYKGAKFEIYGDPAGVGRAQSDESTPFQMLHNVGLDAFPTHTNDPLIRREVVASYMQRLDFSAKPAFRLYEGASNLRRACAGGYQYKRLQITNEERYTDVPNKNKFSHIADACQYAMLGAVGDNSVLGGYGNQKIDYGYIDKCIV